MFFDFIAMVKFMTNCSLNKAYYKLHSLSKAASILGSVQALLDWDQETYMPKESIDIRSQQIEMIASLVHRDKTSKTFAKALAKLIDLPSGTILDPLLSDSQVSAVQNWRRDYLQSIKLSNSFVKKFAQTTARAVHAWQAAKECNDFALFSPHLEKVILLSRKKADALGFKDHPYDALMDIYEPEMSSAILIPIFAQLKTALTALLKKITLKKPFNDEFLYQNCTKDKQLNFANKILHSMGFEPHVWRLDISNHPFCATVHPRDTRMTTLVHPENIMFSIGSVMHEGGHGLYNMNLPGAHYGSPLCEQISLGIDESQSRWWETLIGQSFPFWQHFYPLLQVEFPHQFGNISLAVFYQAVNAVKPGFIRIEADEVSYNLHVIIRFELEKALIDGTLKVKELPEAWNSKMHSYLGITPPSNQQGCLQDIHWACGYIGYFPTYTLGNLYSVQFFKAFEKAHPRWQEQVAQGSLDFISQWLKENIHQYGRQYNSLQLCQKVTGEGLKQDSYMNYLTTKYSKLYDC